MARLFLFTVLLVLPAAIVRAEDWVQWDRASDHVVSAAHDTGAACPKARQLSDGEVLLTYHHGESYGNCGSRVTIRRSRDGGATWFQSQEVESPERGFWGFSNPDVVELGRGRLLLVSAARGRADTDGGDGFFDECRRSGLRLRFSEDYGATWGPPRMIAMGQGRVWEPAVARLPGGELQIFFAIESPALMTGGSTQCIEFVRSTDGGQKWSAPELISREPGCRNGVPNVLPTKDGHVLCAQEVVGMNTSPWIIDTLQGKVLHYGLAQDQYEFGGAPFLARAPDGGTLLAFHSQCRQSAYLRQFSGAWLFSDIYVQRGDAEGRNFGPASAPWPTYNELSGAFFPSLLVLKDGTLLVLASFIHANPDNKTSTVVRAIRGRLLPSSPR
ncbi:MAG: exo-alpha-sialidase [Gluconacetobacter diazotrophicus]|nr:exo-alpha-sialidase [Gluconacetobacter diazotrophicus]